MPQDPTTPIPPSRGEMALRIPAFDWAATPLGPAVNWPQALRVAIDICLNNRFPMHVWWGPDLINIYNDGHIPILGNRHPDALGQPAAKVWHEVWPLLLPQVEAVMLRGQSTWNQRTFVVLQRNGKPEDAWFTWCYSPIRDAAGNIAGLMCISTEDTAQVLAERSRDQLEAERQLQRAEEKRRAEEELRNSTTLLRGISDSTGDIIFAKDRAGRLRFANPATLALLGKSLDQALGKTDLELLDNKDVARAIMENDRRIIESGVAETVEEVVPLADGAHRVWFSQKTPYRDAQGNVLGLLGISRDITQLKEIENQARRAKEEAEAANQAKDHLLSVVSHELRTPLNPILAITSYLQTRKDLSPELREDLHIIRRNVDQEARIVDDLLSLTRLHRGKIVLQQEALDMHALLRAMIEQFTHETAGKGLAFDVNLAAARPYVWADPGRMQQVLSNILGNAAKFTPEGGRITIRTADTSDGKLRLHVSDTGIGIDPAILPRLFTSFEQGEKSTTRRFGGLGLGLVIVKGILDLHQGTITAASPGCDRGTTIVIELATLPPTFLADAPTPAAADSHFPGKRILLVEDHPDTLRVMRRLLQTMGFTVITAASVREAMLKITLEPFDLLLSDIGLPDGSGLDIMREVRRQKGPPPLPGIALSGFGHDDDIRRSKEAGFIEHLTKPVDFQLLDTTLKRVAV